MDGNELDKCPNCTKTVNKNDQFYPCDLCLLNVHKNCANLSPSEVKCMPLQKRLLTFLCQECKKFLGRTSDIYNIIEEMRNEIKEVKTNLNELTNKLHEQKPVQETNLNIKSYSQVLKNETYTFNAQQPTLIIKPKSKQDTEKAKTDIKTKINPGNLKVGIKNMKTTKQGSVILKCNSKQEIETIKNAAESSLGDNYTIEIPKKRTPKVKIIGYTGNSAIKEIEENIRNQNQWIEPDDTYKVDYIHKIKNRNCSKIFLDCCPKLFSKLMNKKKVCINWERYPVYEDLNITRCFTCQGYNHKSNKCNKKQVCEYCAGEHYNNMCTKQYRKCNNCAMANIQFHKQYDTDHTASDPNCPSTRYHIEIMRSRINYEI